MPVRQTKGGPEVSTLRSTISAHAQHVGLDALEFAPVGITPHADAFQQWLNQGHHGDMTYLSRNVAVRVDPRARMPGAQTAVVVAMNHAHRRPPDPGGLTGAVARYAWGRDYHNILGKRVRRLVRRLRADGMGAWGGVDTAPVLERSWGWAAGAGFVGKNTLLIVPGTGSWMLLGVVFIDGVLDSPIAVPLGDHCGTCRRCLDICPTHAFTSDRVLDARRCLSYWNIESRDLAPAQIRAAQGRWFFGCDLCQEVCPHNHHPPDADHPDLQPRHAWVDLPQILATPDAALLERFTGTPLRRPGASGLKRNAAVCLGNLGNEAAIPALEQHGLIHPSPVVRAASVWALRQLGVSPTAEDPHPLVQAELRPASPR